MTFKQVTKEYLDIYGSLVCVQANQLNSWQGFLTRMPVLPLVSFILYEKFGAPEYNRDAILRYCTDAIGPNLTTTTLPSPHIPHLDRHIRTHGLMEIHMHLNGTGEPDHVWLHALENSYPFYQQFKTALKNPIVKEQFDQTEPGIQPRDFYDRLRLAAWLREIMVQYLYQGQPISIPIFDQMRDLTSMPFAHPSVLIPGYHPLSRIDPAFASLPSSVLEGMFHVHVFRLITNQTDRVFSHAYHLYLLLWGFFHRFMVQQEEQFGFDQFEKITRNEIRASSEKTYYQRFLQLSGKNGQDLAYVEGRFAPKSTYHDNVTLLTKIFNGYARFQGSSTKINLFQSESIKYPKKMELRLVAHFIKETDPIHKMGDLVRHHKLRTKVKKNARALLGVWKNSKLLQHHMTGIDVANNEKYAKPEVFAPLYRHFRRHGFEHFTFHAGEDFIHLISGLRTIYEAMTFLQLKRGNRIGHATAVGIDPELWVQRMQPGLMISKQEWLDNLLFTRFLLSDGHNGGAEAVPSIRDDIERLSFDIYQTHLPPSILWDAWEMRHLDPLIACYPSQKSDCLNFDEQIEWDLVNNPKNKQKNAFDLFEKYHMKAYAERGDELLQVKLDDQRFSPTLLRKLQTILLKKLHDAEVVIESMPTSNVRISFYQTHQDHHLWRWLGLKENEEQKHLPPVCLGTDDPGIFVTNLRNEYAHVYERLTCDFGCSPNDAMKHIEQLANNAATYRFIDAPSYRLF